MNMETPQRLREWETEQLKKDAALDKLLYVVPYVCLLILILVGLDVLTMSLYYLQDGIEKTYFKNFPRGRNAIAMTRWHQWMIMVPAAVGLMNFYPADYARWLKQREEEETSNFLFKKLAWTIVLIFSFILVLANVPPGYTDTKILYIYRAATIGTVTLTVLLNHAVLYFINRKKCFDYCGVSERFSKVCPFILLLGCGAGLVTITVTETIHAGDSIGEAILRLLFVFVVGAVGSAIRSWWFGR